MASSVEAEVEIDAPLADVWELYFDPRRWASWVDGFSAVESSSGYPEPGGTLVWRSTPAGRGRVSERVLAHESRELHRAAFSDPAAEGELQTRFEMLPAREGERRTRVHQTLSYSLLGGGPLRRLTDLLFVRSQMRGSLARSLDELRAEAEADSGRPSPG
jgi:uncharacterized protein YndB with AHSA1/START domain